MGIFIFILLGAEGKFLKELTIDSIIFWLFFTSVEAGSKEDKTF